MSLKPCPCGEVPKYLCITGEGTKWATASGNCCNEWNIEFRSEYNYYGRVLTKLATKAWDSTPRKEQEND